MVSEWGVFLFFGAGAVLVSEWGVFFFKISCAELGSRSDALRGSSSHMARKKLARSSLAFSVTFTSTSVQRSAVEKWVPTPVRGVEITAVNSGSLGV